MTASMVLAVGWEVVVWDGGDDRVCDVGGRMGGGSMGWGSTAAQFFFSLFTQAFQG